MVCSLSRLSAKDLLEMRWQTFPIGRDLPRYRLAVPKSAMAPMGPMAAFRTFADGPQAGRASSLGLSCSGTNRADGRYAEPWMTTARMTRTSFLIKAPRAAFLGLPFSTKWA